MLCKLSKAIWKLELCCSAQADGEDELKKRQLMELAIINGTYRDSSAKAVVQAGSSASSKYQPLKKKKYFLSGVTIHTLPYLKCIRLVQVSLVLIGGRIKLTFC